MRKLLKDYAEKEQSEQEAYYLKMISNNQGRVEGIF